MQYFVYLGVYWTFRVEQGKRNKKIDDNDKVCPALEESKWYFLKSKLHKESRKQGAKHVVKKITEHFSRLLLLSSQKNRDHTPAESQANHQKSSSQLRQRLLLAARNPGYKDKKIKEKQEPKNKTPIQKRETQKLAPRTIIIPNPDAYMSV